MTRLSPPNSGATYGRQHDRGIGIFVPVVAASIAQAMQKLGLRTRIDVVRYAESVGWKREEPGDT